MEIDAAAPSPGAASADVPMEDLFEGTEDTIGQYARVAGESYPQPKP